MGQTVKFQGRNVMVRRATAEAFEGMHFVFFAATGALSKTLAPEAARRGAVAIDKSSTWRMSPEVPLVVPEINAGALENHRGIVACPNCTTIGAAMAMAPIRKVAGLRSVVITTLQAASGAGREAIDELSQQERDQIAGREPEAHVFPRPLAGNALPMCERFEPDGYTSEERKLLVETRKIFEEPSLRVSMTCVRVPVVVGHSATLLIETVRPIGIAEARAALADFPGIELVDDPNSDRFPTPRDVAGRDTVLVGRVRRDFETDRIWLWEVSDNLRKGAATNAVQVAELLHQRDLVRVPAGASIS
jgi:aspartate-semialdehyde dehydrogenase